MDFWISFLPSSISWCIWFIFVAKEFLLYKLDQTILFVEFILEYVLSLFNLSIISIP